MVYSLSENPSNPIPLVAFSLNGDCVGHFLNMQEAEYKLGLASGSISNFFSGRNHRAGKYVFLKESEYSEGMKLTYKSIKKKRKFLRSIL